MTTTKTVITTRVMTQYKTKIHTMTILTIFLHDFEHIQRYLLCVRKKPKTFQKRGLELN